MKFILSSIDTSDRESDESVAGDELAYLLGKEKKILAKRNIYSWDSTEPKAEPVNRKRYNASLALSKNSALPATGPPAPTSSPDQVSDLQDKPHEEQVELAELPDLDLSGLIDIELWEKEEQVQVLADQSNEKAEADINSFDQPEDRLDEVIEADCWVDDDDADEDVFAFDPYDFIDSVETEEKEVDWLDLAGEADDFAEELTSEFSDVDIEGTVSREDRALQAAMEIGSEHDLTIAEIETVAIIFLENGWSACRVAITRELSNGTSMDEIELAAAIKEIWMKHCEFYSGQQSNYKFLSWPIALKLANSFGGYPCPEEVEDLLVRLHQHWRTDNIQRRVFMTFNEYLIDYVDRVEEGFEYCQEWCVAQEQIVLDDIFLPPSSTDLPDYHDFELERSLRMVRQAYCHQR